MVDFRFRAWSAGDTTQDVAAAAAGDGRRRRRCCPRQRALGWPRSGQSGRAAAAGREAAGAAEGREVAMQPKAARRGRKAAGGRQRRPLQEASSSKAVALGSDSVCGGSSNQRP